MPFVKGQSGNPAGRPRGVRDKRRQYLELLEDDLQAISAKAIQLAKSGNTQMIKLILERVLPAKPEDTPLVKGFDLVGDSYTQASQIMRALSDGILTPTQAHRMMKCTATYLATVDARNITERIEVLEKRNPVK